HEPGVCRAERLRRPWKRHRWRYHFSGPRALDLGDDDPRFLRGWLHGVSAEAVGIGLAPRLISAVWFRKAASGRLFSYRSAGISLLPRGRGGVRDPGG